MIFNLLLVFIVLFLYSIIMMNTKFENKEKRSKLFLRIVFILFFILVASREMTTGNDTPMYLNLFEKCSSIKWKAVDFDGYFESGYLIFNILISYISSSKRFFMIVMSAIFNFVVYYFIKKNSKNYLFSVLIYICMLNFYSSMTMMRQFMAMMIMLSSFKFVKEKKIIPFVLSVILASLFHSSAWIAILYYPIYHMKYTKIRSLMIMLVAVIFTMNIGPIINYIYGLLNRTNYYTSSLGSNDISNYLYTIIYFIFYLFALYKIRNCKEATTKEYHYYLYTFFVASMINLIATNMNILVRAGNYFTILSIVCMPNILELNTKYADNKKIVNIIFFVFLIAYSCVITQFRPEWNSAYDYKTCIFQKDGYICGEK